MGVRVVIKGRKESMRGEEAKEEHKGRRGERRNKRNE